MKFFKNFKSCQYIGKSAKNAFIFNFCSPPLPPPRIINFNSKNLI